ncbi:MAG: hypothetical protein JKY55_19455 [Aliivibrio sp.]|uniref:hypothetical protein n=1 Tax=Aliivibrio sp. TaxID=1872443 RepID=UPI001A412E74|nr:hypothetical protein [Aliivibrio sp.]
MKKTINALIIILIAVLFSVTFYLFIKNGFTSIVASLSAITGGVTIIALSCLPIDIHN